MTNDVQPGRAAPGIASPSKPFPFETSPPPAHRPSKGRRFIVLGSLIMVAATLAPTIAAYALDLSYRSEDELLPLILLGSLVVYAAFLWGVRLISIGRRMRAPPAQDVLGADPRGPVLFLRSFEDDDLIDPTPLMVPMGDMFQRRYEETLCKPLSTIGPVISVGRPGNELPMLGGARLFVPHHAWKSAVEFLRGQAAGVILMVGRTEGVWWEITSSIQSVPLERILFFFPYVENARLRRSVWQRLLHFIPARMPLSTKAYRRMEAERQARYALFRERVQPLLPAPLPEELGRSQFIDFLPDGTPRRLGTVRPWWWPIAVMAPSTAKMAINLRRTLAPFVSKIAGVESSRRRALQ